ncbi:MAG: glycosyltransferase family 4 protein [Chitinophagales bacterium]|nr:glycosyltransferase family 4 protein [Chitinophagales bacterium]
MRILFLTPYPRGSAPSQRFRFEHYYQTLTDSGISFHTQSFLDDKAWSVLYQQGMLLQKAAAIFRGFLRRTFCLFTLTRYDFVFIHREAAPVGPPIFEWCMARVFRKKIIYDFDDAIWLPNASDANRFASSVKYYHKVASICRWACKISVGNDFLADYARQFNTNVQVMPTVVDTEKVYRQLKDQDTPTVVVGWTGTHSTIRFLEPLLPLVLKVCHETNAHFLVIADKSPAIDFEKFEFVKWKEETEAEDVLRMNIGIMPLGEDDWSKGKCGFKAIQYMALGIPAIVSPVGVNSKIVDHNTNGFLCNNDQEWEAALRKLIADAALRTVMGKAAQLKIRTQYSKQAWSNGFLKLFS